MSKPNVVVLTGAGISAESGLKTFRDNNGLWEEHRVEEVATPEAFARNPDLVYRFYNLRRQALLSGQVQPNAAHHALVQLEQYLGGRFTLVTQNVDDLHQRAGSKRLLPMHGELLKARCCRTDKLMLLKGELDRANHCRCCEPPSSMRPHIVWFGEMPLYMDEIYEALWQADIFVAIGTSGTVYPAAGLVAEANRNGAHTLELNLESSDSDFKEKRRGRASELVPDWVNEILELR
ncbi:NAD-dependent protein deacylase [Saliniradius amylolyticus]|uniref:NAD-dependent protein deacylase n=1 Tax=Saliniradius amylolyticus TaxID=2183582 RepID=A0A2S2E2S9_9ALTE|nr:Sir2 family NAD+-dependent deacetylase [Saliniradius amylolyticus]AWL11966.1 NAD-dependent protein deacylase [Saliniradius amylolyticus]